MNNHLLSHYLVAILVVTLLAGFFVSQRKSALRKANQERADRYWAQLQARLVPAKRTSHVGPAVEMQSDDDSEASLA